MEDVAEPVTETKTLEQIETVGDYLHLFGEDLIRRLNDEYQSVHHPVTDSIHERLSELKRSLFPAQAHVVSALFKGYQKQGRHFLIGGTGTGKTAMSAAASYVLAQEHHQGKARIIYMVPNHLVKKTKREILKVIGEDRVEVQFIRSFKDLIRLHESGKFRSKPRTMEFYIIARDTAKLGYYMEPAAKWVDRTYTVKAVNEEGDVIEQQRTAFRGWVCPDCGQQLVKVQEDGMVPLAYDDFYDKRGKARRIVSNQKCFHCHSPLWQAKNKYKYSISGEVLETRSNAPRKVAPAVLFKKWFKGAFDFAIGDEAHELTAKSAQAHAFGILINCAKKVLAMTATMINGYASNLFELSFRMFPQKLLKMGFTWNDIGRWVDLYGAREKTIKEMDADLNSSSKGSKRIRIKEIPAAAPQLFTDVLSDVSCFIQLSDLFDQLPELKEGPMLVPIEGKRMFIQCKTRIRRGTGKKTRLSKHARIIAPSWYLDKNFSEVEEQLREAVKKELENGSTVLLGSLLSTLLSYPDVPFNFKGVYHPDTGEEIISPSYRLSERLIYPKEQELMRFVKSQVRQKRNCVVYATFTKKHKTLDRLQTLLEERGIKTAIMRSEEVPGEQREEWIEQQENDGVQSILAHPQLFETGLDLLGFPSIVFYQQGYRLNTVRQAKGRHRRIGQKKLCITSYMSYQDTMQELALNLIATKMNAAMALEGQFSLEGLSAMSDASSGSIANELAKRFVGKNVDGVDSAENIWGSMSVDAEELIANASDETTDSQDPLVYTAPTIQEALQQWADEQIPADLLPRITNQIAYVEQNVKAGLKGLSYIQTDLFEPIQLVWDESKVSRVSTEFREWVYHLTNKPISHEPTAQMPFDLVEEKASKKKMVRKKYQVASGQLAFNFQKI